jgi:DNA-binding PadR family transcriptional regulator
MYPLLHGLEQKGLLVSRQKRIGRSYRKIYKATAVGRKALATAKQKVLELFGELFERRQKRV